MLSFIRSTDHFHREERQNLLHHERIENWDSNFFLQLSYFDSREEKQILLDHGEHPEQTS